MAVTVVNAVRPKRVVHRAEPTTLVPNGEPVPESFGAGDGRLPAARHEVVHASPSPRPPPIVGVLHYQARDCGKDEVTIELNGAQLGQRAARHRRRRRSASSSMVLPSTQLKINEPNELVFDNVDNPPANDPWADLERLGRGDPRCRR